LGLKGFVVVVVEVDACPTKKANARVHYTTLATNCEEH